MRMAIYMRVGTQKQLESMPVMQQKFEADTGRNMLGYPREAWMKLGSNNEMLRKICGSKEVEGTEK